MVQIIHEQNIFIFSNNNQIVKHSYIQTSIKNNTISFWSSKTNINWSSSLRFCRPGTLSRPNFPRFPFPSAHLRCLWTPQDIWTETTTTSWKHPSHFVKENQYLRTCSVREYRTKINYWVAAISASYGEMKI